jgi:hypothetical protein
VNLAEALTILIEVHTSIEMGGPFDGMLRVHIGATPNDRAPWHSEKYVEAWSFVRNTIAAYRNGALSEAETEFLGVMVSELSIRTKPHSAVA